MYEILKNKNYILRVALEAFETFYNNEPLKAYAQYEWVYFKKKLFNIYINPRKFGEVCFKYDRKIFFWYLKFNFVNGNVSMYTKKKILLLIKVARIIVVLQTL